MSVKNLDFGTKLTQYVSTSYVQRLSHIYRYLNTATTFTIIIEGFDTSEVKFSKLKVLHRMI